MVLFFRFGFKIKNNRREKIRESEKSIKNEARGKLRASSIKNKKSPRPIASRIFFFKIIFMYKIRSNEIRVITLMLIPMFIRNNVKKLF